MKQDHFTTAAESASARNRQRDGVQGSDKRSMRGLCMCFDKIQRKAIHAKDRVHNRACTPSWRMKQDHFATAAESASARNRQRDGVQGYDKRLMRGFCMCFENFQSKVIHAKKTASKSVHVHPHGVQRRSLGAVAKCACVQSKWAFLGAPTSDRSAVFASASNRFEPLPNQEIYKKKPRSKQCTDALVAFKLAEP